MTMQQSVFARRRKLHGFIKSGEAGERVLRELLPEGEAHLYERALWDYKFELPTRVSKTGLSDHDVRMAEVVKDAVSFYNAYGGYLVVGVRDNPREIVGFDLPFDCDDLNRRIRAATRHDVECHFSLLKGSETGLRKTVGLLLVPQRPESLEPAQFVRDAPVGANGKRSYRSRDIYFRQGDECKPAQLSEDFAFLCGQARRQLAEPIESVLTSVLDNNLGPRDPGLLRFIGRQEYLQELWRWLCDRFSPAKVLAAHGGVGKTTIARAFAEMILQSSPLAFERVIWLSAKPRDFVAITNAYESRAGVDFVDTESLLRALLAELGTPAGAIGEEVTREEIEEELLRSLEIIPSFFVVDDVDSLNPNQQQEVFHSVLRIVGQTNRTARVPSRALITARLDLGAAPAQLIHVTGMKADEFREYVQMTAEKMRIKFEPSGSHMRKFHHVTQGSPTFAASVLRLLQMGESLVGALERWQGAEGEEVRRFAFQKELDQLSEAQIRTLFATCTLGETSFIELQHITQSSESRLRDDLGELRKYQLLSLESDAPYGGARLVAPNGIRFMAGLIRERVRDPTRIEHECRAVRAGSAKLGMDVGRIVQRVVALWGGNRPAEALEVAQWGDRQTKDHPDLKCLLGRAYLRLDPPDARQAELAFRKAFELSCRRPELLSLWIEAKRLLSDWVGTIEITRLGDQEVGPSADMVCIRAQAMSSLAEIAYESGHLLVAADHYLKAGREIDEAFKKGNARGRVVELVELRALMFQNYVRLMDQMTPLGDERIEVWRACLNAFDAFVRRAGIIELGVERLGDWWTAVERRGGRDVVAADLMKAQLQRLNGVVAILKDLDEPNAALILRLLDRKRALEGRLARYLEEE